jgi:hypothetical protein
MRNDRGLGFNKTSEEAAFAEVGTPEDLVRLNPASIHEYLIIFSAERNYSTEL